MHRLFAILLRWKYSLTCRRYSTSNLKKTLDFDIPKFRTPNFNFEHSWGGKISIKSLRLFRFGSLYYIFVKFVKECKNCFQLDVRTKYWINALIEFLIKLEEIIDSKTFFFLKIPSHSQTKKTKNIFMKNGIIGSVTLWRLQIWPKIV